MGDRPITALTRKEELILKHGFLTEQEQREKQRDHGPGGRRKYSAPRRSTKEAMADYQRKIEQANQQGATA